MAREPRFLPEYAELFEKIGKTAFQVKHRGSVLVGQGMVARVSDRPLSWARRTLATLPMEALQAVPSVAERVWRVRKDPGAQRGPNITLGQSADNDIIVPEYTISTQHCGFVFDAAGLSITDLGSLNGTLVDGALIEPGVNMRLKDKMVLTLGRIQFLYLTQASFLEHVESLTTAAS